MAEPIADSDRSPGRGGVNEGALDSRERAIPIHGGFQSGTHRRYGVVYIFAGATVDAGSGAGASCASSASTSSGASDIGAGSAVAGSARAEVGGSAATASPVIISSLQASEMAVVDDPDRATTDRWGVGADRDPSE